ncbi:MAG TPA: M6 family metalloprotease domain-containing protein [Anaerolineaceae bacterium]|mgnify:CR=1 FL=1|nr:M6 family metalloprotease domain-containing protein [Anaerolineaceae bacterium]
MKNFRLLCFLAVLTACLIAGLSFEAVSAAPAAPIEHTLFQPNGSSLTALQWGDEWSNGFETLDGYTIIQDDLGWWVFAQVVDGRLEPYALSGKTFRADFAVPFGLDQHQRPKTEVEAREQRPDQSLNYQNSGNQSTLVLLAEFTDRTATYPLSHFSASVFGASSSVKHFYNTASYSNLVLIPAVETYGTSNDGVIGWLNLGYSHPNTGGSTSNQNQLITKNALIAADSYINYASYDNNSDGYISANELHIMVAVAGYEYSYSNNNPSIWAHHWDLNSVGLVTLDGVTLGDWYHNGGYSQFGEIHLDHPATIGVMAHELGHDLSWPDLYDTDGSSDGLGVWSIMSSGSWNRTGTNFYGTSPALPDAWLKWYQGWLTPTVVSGTIASAPIYQAENNASAYVLCPNPGGVNWEFYQYSGSGEYFLVENRQLVSYDAALPGCGLNILHIDEGVTNSNSANANEYHPLVKFMQADGLDELLWGDSYDFERGDNGDPFPGVNTNRTFNYNSTPNSRLYSGADSLAAVINISNCGTTMTADLSYSGVTNQSPVANAGPDQFVFTNLMVTLDGSGSFDPDGNYPLTYSWSQVSGPAVTLSNPGAVYPTFIAPSQPAIVVLQLVVTDSLGAIAIPDNVIITILNNPPVADAGSDQTVSALAMVTLDGTGSFDPDGNLPLLYSWFQTSGAGAPLSNPNAAQPTFQAPPIVGVMTFDLYVTDSLGTTSPPDSVTITVQNQAPVANAGSDQTVIVNTLVTLDGTASLDPDGHLPLMYLWTQTGGPLVLLDNPAACSPGFVSPLNGVTLTFSLVVTDSLMVPSVPDTVSIFVIGSSVYLPMLIR